MNAEGKCENCQRKEKIFFSLCSRCQRAVFIVRSDSRKRNTKELISFFFCIVSLLFPVVIFLRGNLFVKNSFFFIFFLLEVCGQGCVHKY